MINNVAPKDCVALPPSLGDCLLDSRLISATQNEKLYNVKLIDCNNYMQIYFFENKKKRSTIDDEKELFLKKLKCDEEKKCIDENPLKKIELKNITRSKLKCQRLAKCNSDIWETFITLTIKENIKDINIANKLYKQFKDCVRRVFPNFKCICVPEFQKRGAVHYHLLTNISVDNNKLIFKQNDNEKYLHIKYWNIGFTKVDNVKNDIKKIIGYISKYMTKDIDNRLFNHHRYFYTKNLRTPTVNYLDLDNQKHISFLKSLLNNKKMIYKNNYFNSYNNEKIAFEEFFINS